MSEPYRRPQIASWLVPASVGPFVAAYVAAVITAFLGPVDGHLRWVVLVIGLAVATLWASLYVLLSTLLDVGLLAIKVRTLPTGKIGWLQSVAAPGASIGSYAIIQPHKWLTLGPWAVAIALAAPPLVAILGTRVFFGKKPQ